MTCIIRIHSNELLSCRLRAHQPLVLPGLRYSIRLLFWIEYLVYSSSHQQPPSFTSKQMQNKCDDKDYACVNISSSPTGVNGVPAVMPYDLVFHAGLAEHCSSCLHAPPPVLAVRVSLSHSERVLVSTFFSFLCFFPSFCLSIFHFIFHFHFLSALPEPLKTPLEVLQGLFFVASVPGHSSSSGSKQPSRSLTCATWPLG